MIRNLKSKLFLSGAGALIIVLAAGGWYLNRVIDQRDVARMDVRSYQSALETTTASFDDLRRDFQRLETILTDRDRERARLREQNRELSQELQNERQRSEEFDACYDVELSDDYRERLQRQSNRSGDEDS